MTRKTQPTPAPRSLTRTTRDAPVPMALFDMAGRFLAASKSWEQITNIRGLDYLGRTIGQVAPTTAPERIEMHRRAGAGEHFVNAEEEYVDSEGVRRWLCCEYRPAPGPDGALMGYFAHGHDITPMIAARRDAQANAERLSLAMGAARAGVSELDFANKTMWASPEFNEIVGVEVDFLRFAREPWYMAHPDDRPLIDSVIGDWTDARHEPFDIRIVLPSGDVRWVEVHGEQQLNEQGRRTKIVGLILDIDARKRQELALVEAERAAQAAAEAKSQFLANMSHEIRTPMNGVLGVLHLLERENLSAEGRQLLEEAGNCGRMLAQLLNDVIDFSRIEAGRLDLSPEPLDAAQVLESVANLLRPNATAKGLTLRTRAPDDAIWIQADPVRLRQALFNLIGNAVKFTQEGHVEIRLTASREDGMQRLRFEIEDTGVGIPEAVQATLFRRFQQADGSTSRRFGGSGLGLAITRRLAELMEGEVGFVSKEGEGSTFWLGIAAPIAEPVAVSVDNPAPAPALEGLNVLLVEDNPTNRLVASKMLESMGIQVTTAEDGRLGVQAARASSPDLILMDVQMPVMDGLEATRIIRALDGPISRTPIVGLTANAMAHQQSAYLGAGMNGVVAKPISPAALIGEISRVMSDVPDVKDTAAA